MAQEAGSRLISALRKQNEKTAYFCAAGNLSPNVIVHEIRKSFKRIRALLHFYDETPDFKIIDFKEKVKEIGRELSVLRESYVNVLLFENEISGNQLIAERKLKSALEKLLKKNNEQIELKFSENKLCLEIQLLLEEFNSYLEDISLAPAKKQFFTETLATYRKGYDIYQSLPAEQPPEEMHELRKKLKRLWYQLDFLRFMQPRFFRVKTDQLNHISEHLGIDHDLFVFLEELKTDYLNFTSEEKQILENQVLHLRELNLVKLNPRLTQFFSESPEDFETKMQKIFKLE